MIKKIYPVISLFILIIFLSSWGAVGHRIINNKCPASFPSAMTGFQMWKDSLTTNAANADNRKNSDPNESPKHFIDIDNYSEFLSKGRIASTYDSIVAIHGLSNVIYNGTLPWATLNMYDTLVVDFKKLKWHKAMLDASDLGHYVADGHMPLHLTANYDGGKTNQSGIHSRYESTMVSAYQSNLALYSGEQVNFVSNVNKYIFDYIYINYHYLDSVLLADTYARNLVGNTTSTQYTAALWSKAQFTTKLFHNASKSLAELIYSAWVEAGSPVFGTKTFVNGIEQTSAVNILVYPNPTTGVINVSSDEDLKIEVCSITGTSLGNYTGKQIDLSKLSNGMYILSMVGKDGLNKKEKILISK